MFAFLSRLKSLSDKVLPLSSLVRTFSIIPTARLPVVHRINMMPLRWTTYGQEYQPSSLRRRRKFGYLARLRTRGGRKVLHRRIMKGRKYLVFHYGTRLSLKFTPGMSVRVVTNEGDLVVKLHIDKAPRACCNFLKLCKLKYYHWCLFHRVERGFIAQSGDPTGTGTGGMSVEAVLDHRAPKYFGDEFCKQLRHRGKGVMGMVNTGGGQNGSQFYVTLGDRPLDYLDDKYTIFGQVIEGMDVLDRINAVHCDGKLRPYHDIFIKHTVILDDPFPDPKGFIPIDRSPPPSRVFADQRRYRADEEPISINEKTEQQALKEEARARAITLEMIGERDSADLKPPENVLFVCKLNPLTEADDLKMIFSRFGTILKCDVIKDRRTGRSLGFAFIEFSEKEECEEAYLKMDKVLIDDRRIHVDFSQSVSKLHQDWLQGRESGSGGVSAANGGVREGDYRNEQRRDYRDERRRDYRDEQRRDKRDEQMRDNRDDRSRDYRDERRRDYRDEQRRDNRDYQDGHRDRNNRDYRSRDNRDSRDY
ncbi:hypothetical protein PSACC_00398 [Paramicrosporidium saccamoebae]|uniref:Peptidyl-prolyl cis-trans isomerase n=1 Tax=Paramicrosporidium saccamoebae TaxID=1246581 RepID=A0A2H9TPS6_9FUNG|nr:hypothetical protein PSACC_00398 [Paramicrosporidium saccamoebae]